jgi:hypothetical protein
MLQGGASGVIKDPSGQGFSAMVWELDQNSSLGLCTFFRQQNAYCDVMTPESFASIATLRGSEREGSAGPPGGRFGAAEQKSASGGSAASLPSTRYMSRHG